MFSTAARTVPTEAEAWDRFWALLTPALVDLHLEGGLRSAVEVEAELGLARAA